MDRLDSPLETLCERIAQENDGTHLAWNADLRNIRGLDFDRRLGAEIIEQHGNRCFFRWVPRFGKADAPRTTSS